MTGPTPAHNAPPPKAGLADAVILAVLVCGAFAVAALLAYRLYGLPSTGVDDAQITLDYSVNIAQGHGIVYNAAGPRVEGITSLLWALLGAVPVRLGLPPEPVMLGLAVLCGGLALAGLALFLTRGPRQGGDAPAADGFYLLLFLLLVLASPSYVSWVTITLMDVGLWSALMCVAAVLILWVAPERRWHGLTAGLAVVVALLVLTRPEALLVAPCVILLFGAQVALVDGRRAAGRALLTLGAVFAASAGGLTLFRLLYFGYPLPNTFYAKVSPSLAYNLQEGQKYLEAYLHNSPFATGGALLAAVLSVLAVPVVLRAFVARRSSPDQATPLPAPVITGLLSLLLLLLPVLTGGDHFVKFRFLQPAYPLLCLTLILSLRQARWHGLLCAVSRATSPAGRSLCTAVLLLLVGGFILRFAETDSTWFILGKTQPLANEFAIARDGLKHGQVLERVLERDGQLPTLGVVMAGGIKRTYRGRVIDLMGLNEPAMGHSAGDRRGTKNHAAFNVGVFWQLRPDIVMPESAPVAEHVQGRIAGFMNGVFHGLLRTPEFQRAYTFASVARLDADGANVATGFFRQEYLTSLEQTPGFEVKRLPVSFTQ